jgi:hypothetical protein
MPIVALSLARLLGLAHCGLLAHDHRTGDLVPHRCVVAHRPIPAGRRRATEGGGFGVQARATGNPIRGFDGEEAHQSDWVVVAQLDGGRRPAVARTVGRR